VTASSPHGGRSVSSGGTAESAANLDRVLSLLEHQRRSPAELRLLVALVDGEMTVAELADDLGDRSLADVTEMARKLATAGLIRYRLTHERGETVVAITCTGLVTVRPLLTAASSAGRSRQPRPDNLHSRTV
jgi:predicted transcriptional regulator